MNRDVPQPPPLSYRYVNLFAALLLLVVSLIAALSYTRIWNTSLSSILFDAWDFGWLAFGLIIAGVIVHELLHGVGFICFGAGRWTDLRFGFKWRCMAAYATCSNVMPMSAYRGSCALPGLVLGVLPGVIGLTAGNVDWLAYGCLFIGAAGGDAAILWHSRHIPPATLVRDAHVTSGCEIVRSGTPLVVEHELAG